MNDKEKITFSLIPLSYQPNGEKIQLNGTNKKYIKKR